MSCKLPIARWLIFVLRSHLCLYHIGD